MLEHNDIFNRRIETNKDSVILRPVVGDASSPILIGSWFTW